MRSDIILPLIIGVQKPKLDEADLRLIAEIRPAGFILFDRNILSAAQTRQLTDSMREACGFEPLIAIDQEGGNVSRLASIVGLTPSAEQLGNYNDTSATHDAGKLTGELLSLLGINWNLAPVLDIASTHSNSLRGRCFGQSPDSVTLHAGAYIEGLHNAGVLCCGKHFPGMGGANADPHHGKSIVKNTHGEIESCDLLPFRELADKLDALMLAHAIYPDFTGSTPASLSDQVCQQMARQLKGFTGLLVTDDLDMGAITDHTENCFEAALNAGNDLLLVCHEMEKLTADMIPGDFDPNRLPKPTSPVKFSESQFSSAAKALNEIGVR